MKCSCGREYTFDVEKIAEIIMRADNTCASPMDFAKAIASSKDIIKVVER